MRRRRLGVTAGLLVGLAAMLAMVWRCGGEEHAARSTQSVMATGARGSSRTVDVKTLRRGTVAGAVVDERKQPIAGARVCADGTNATIDPTLFREAACTTTAVSGRFELENLLPAEYVVGAGARGFRPATRQTRVDGSTVQVEIVLRSGGVELTGIVLDVTGGPIATARVSANGASTESDAKGEFSLWVAPTSLALATRADGYVDNSTWVDAPCRVEILMFPEATVSGVVVDGVSGEPVNGARVFVRPVGRTESTPDEVMSTADGTFTARGLFPGRYATVALTDHGFGRSDSAVQVGIGERVDGVTVKLYPGVRLDGTVVFTSTKDRCPKAEVSITEPTKGYSRAFETTLDGHLWAQGVLPGTYKVRVSCEQALIKAEYPPIVIADHDVSDLVWEVDRGATLEGHVAFASGQPAVGVQVYVVPEGRGAGNATTAADGSYRITGLIEGQHRASVWGEEITGSKDGVTVDLKASRATRQDFVVSPAATLKGNVTDQEGKPVQGFDIQASSVDNNDGGEARTDARGEFIIRRLSPGDYWVHEPWTHKNRTTVRVGEPAYVKIVVEVPKGMIRGLVLDSRGQPVVDAFVTFASDDDGPPTFWRSVLDPKAAITNTSGAFTLRGFRLSGTYAVLAYRSGGDEATVEHVRAGDNITLRLEASSSIEGTVERDGKPVDDFEIAVTETIANDAGAFSTFSRRERFYKTHGRFKLDGLPRKRLRITASAEGSQTFVDVELRSGERTNLKLSLESLVTVTGRVVDHPSGLPVAGARVYATRSASAAGISKSDSITDAKGQFTLTNVPRGTISIRAHMLDENTYIEVIRTIDGPGPIDVGVLTRVRMHWTEDAAGLGFEVKAIHPDTPAAQRSLIVTTIASDGPAAKADLRVGDVVTSIDGVDLRGGNSPMFTALAYGAAGTSARVTLERGVTIELVRR